jgi:hypothetical protein
MIIEEERKNSVTIKTTAKSAIVDKAQIFSEARTESIDEGIARTKLERAATVVKRRESEVLANAIRLIDEEIAKIDLESKKLASKEDASLAAKEVLEEEARKRIERKAVMKDKWESKDSNEGGGKAAVGSPSRLSSGDTAVTASTDSAAEDISYLTLYDP